MPNKNVITLCNVKLNKKSRCNLEYIYQRKPLRKLFNWILCRLTSRYNQSCTDLKIVNIFSRNFYQEMHNTITIILIKISYNANNYIKNLLKRNDLLAFFRATGNKIMLYSKSTSKQIKDYNKERIIAYAEPILKLARALYDGQIYFDAYKSLKVNYYSLNPKDLYDSLSLLRNVFNNASLELEDIDIEKNTLHEDFSPRYAAFNGNNALILTFCILRGINGYEPSMGKTLIFPNITQGQKLEIIPQDDNDDYFIMCIFLADVVEHGSSIWNTNHPKVLEQFMKVRNGNITDEPWQPARMSITMPIYFETTTPKQLWCDIQTKLQQSHI